MKLLIQSSNKIRGFTLTELAIVLGIVGLLLGAIWVAAANVSNSQKIAKAIQEVNMINQNVRGLYAAKTYYPTAGDITSYAIQANVFPADMVSNGLVMNPWATSATNSPTGHEGISLSTQGGYGSCPENPNILAIVFWGVDLSPENCVQLLSSFIGPAVKKDVAGLYTDAFGCMANPAAATASQLVAFCGTSPGTKNIVFYMYK